MNSPYKIAVLGLWHCGEIFSTCLAELGHRVVGISDDQNLIENFSKGIPPLPESQLADLMAKNLTAGNLSYATDFGKIKDCDILWLTFDTPVDDEDNVDTTVVYEALQKAAPHLQNGALIVATSQLPVGSAKKITETVKKIRPDLRFDYAYVPENLRLGEAVDYFMKPQRIVIGAESEAVFQKIEDIFRGLNAEYIRMSAPSAEMSKHALNAFLATSISFINDIADLAEKIGADILDIVKALRSDPRVGTKAFLDAGLGFSGGTLGRDLKALLAAGRTSDIDPIVIGAVFEKNKSRKNLIINRLREEMGDVKGKIIAVLGLTYKAGTKTLRRSRPVEIAADLIKGGAVVRLYDPCVDMEELSLFIKNPDFYANPYEATRGAHAVVLATPWPEFKQLDFSRLKGAAGTNPIFFDTSNFLWDKEAEINSSGFRYLGVGRK